MRRLIRTLFLASACSAASIASGQGQSAVPEVIDSGLLGRISRFESGFDAANRLSGVLLIARGDSVVFHRAFGYRDPSRSVANRLDTPSPGRRSPNR